MEKWIKIEVSYKCYNKKMTEREIINKRVPMTCQEQMTLQLDQKKRDELTGFLHDDFKRDLIENGFDVIGSSFRGKSDESIERKFKVRDKNGQNKLMWDLCGMKFIFKTDEEIDEVIRWVEKEYLPPERYDDEVPWIRDFRKDEVKNEIDYPFMQPDYRAVHIRLPFQLTIEGEEYVDLMEVQLVTDEQEAINKSTRAAFESAFSAVLSKRVDLNSNF